jgi:hypothetical protein
MALTKVQTGMMGAGAVLQVVNATYSTSTSNSTSTYADTGLTATITPLFSTSKILIIVDQNGLYKSSASNTTSMNIQLLRGATNIGVFSQSDTYTFTASENQVGSASYNYLDSPATTSATTYKTQFSSRGNTAFVNVQNGSSISTITLMEIAV